MSKNALSRKQNKDVERKSKFYNSFQKLENFLFMSGLPYLFSIECAYFNEVGVHLRAEGIYDECGKKILDCFWLFKRVEAFLTYNLFSEIYNTFSQTS
ncbi:MAG: hypothetical protein ACK56I_14220, partial [bacterium]